ncbi:MAG: peroxidase [Gemmataceae bacterium]|nr:peroxidase [Gemmataceae bacterium]
MLLRLSPVSRGTGRPHCVHLKLEPLEERCVPDAGIRALDGIGNNVRHPQWGAAGTDLARMAAPAYDDGFASMGGAARPSPRAISNAVAAQGNAVLFNNRAMSDWVWQWGQFLDHDLDLTPTGSTEPAPIAVPAGDPFFDPFHTGTRSIGFSRSVSNPATGTGVGNPREQPNAITAYIDGSQIYGSDPARAEALRTHDGGKLKTSPGNLLPVNNLTYFATMLDNANGGPVPNDQLYVAGDVRANEQIGLTAIHTLFVREHNRLADELAAAHPTWTDEQIYQQARRLVGAELQAITYNEFLPALLGPYAPRLRGSYDAEVPATITTEFSTAAFRVGHTLLSSQLLRVRNDGTADPRGALGLQNSFFNPALLTTSTDLEVLLKGLASQRAQEIDNKIVDGVRNFLFGPPGAGGLDLAALNIQRGRDHGLADYNTTRAAFGLPRVASFTQITSDVTLQNALASLYGTVDNIDLWVGALAEDHLPGASVGPTIAKVLRDQFQRLRDCDRLFFTRDPAFRASEIARLCTTTLADVIRRNTGLTILQPNVFFVHGQWDLNPDAPGGAGGSDASAALASAQSRTVTEFVVAASAPATSGPSAALPLAPLPATSPAGSALLPSNLSESSAPTATSSSQAALVLELINALFADLPGQLLV